MLPLTVGFLVAGPISGTASDRFGSRGLATAGALLCAAGFAGLLLLPVNFSYVVFALLLALVGVSQGMFTSPNSAPRSWARSRPASAGSPRAMRATFVNSGTAISIGVFFTLMIAGLSSRLPKALGSGLHAAGLTAHAAHSVASLPAGLLSVRRPARDQPAAPPAGRQRRARETQRAGPRAAHRTPFLPPSADAAVPRRAARRLRHGRRAVTGWRRSPRCCAAPAAHGTVNPEPQESP